MSRRPAADRGMPHRNAGSTCPLAGFRSAAPKRRHRADVGSKFPRNKPSLNLLHQCLCVSGEVAMSHHVRPPQYAWGYDWPDDCPPPYYPPPARVRVAVHLPPCKPHAGINTDWSGNKCAPLHKSSSYALLPAPSAQPQASLSAPPAQPHASLSAPPAQPQVSQPAPPAQPTPSKPAAEPVTVGQAAHDHAAQASAMGNLGFDVAIGLVLALAFAVVRRFILDMIEPPRPSH
jgi:hypothetical protein